MCISLHVEAVKNLLEVSRQFVDFVCIWLVEILPQMGLHMQGDTGFFRTHSLRLVRPITRSRLAITIGTSLTSPCISCTVSSFVNKPLGSSVSVVL